MNGNHKLQEYHQNYGFQLENALAKYPIKELNQESDKSRLLELLQKGNRQFVTLIQDDKESKFFVEAKPRFKSINVYDSNLQRINNGLSKEKKQTTREGQITNLKVKSETKKYTQAITTTEGSEETKHQKKNSRRLS